MISITLLLFSKIHTDIPGDLLCFTEVFQSQEIEALCVLFLHLIYKAWRLLECRKLPGKRIKSKRPGFILAWFFQPYRTQWRWKTSQMNIVATPSASKVLPPRYSSSQRHSLVCERRFPCINSSNSQVRLYDIFLLQLMKVRSRQRHNDLPKFTDNGDVRVTKWAYFIL